MLLQADVMLQPSVTAADGDIEGSPVVLSEAMASGLPVISSFHSGIPELVTDGQTGLLAPERDVTALSRHIEWVADHPAEAATMARGARAFVEAEFDNDRLNDQLCEIVEAMHKRAP
jgi:colanic acid/amylovoran biosynthesis glycosyltransferase